MTMKLTKCLIGKAIVFISLIKVSYTSEDLTNQSVFADKYHIETNEDYQQYLRRLSKDKLKCENSGDTVSDDPDVAYRAYLDFIEEHKAEGAAVIFPVEKDETYSIRCLCGNGCAQHKSQEVDIPKDDDELHKMIDEYHDGLVFSGSANWASDEWGRIITRRKIQEEKEESAAKDRNRISPLFWLVTLAVSQELEDRFQESGKFSIIRADYENTSNFLRFLVGPGFIQNLRRVKNILTNLCSFRRMNQNVPTLTSASKETLTASNGDVYYLEPRHLMESLFQYGRNQFDSKHLKLIADLYEQYIAEVTDHVKRTHNSLLIKDSEDIPIDKICGAAIYDPLFLELVADIKSSTPDAYVKVLKERRICDTSLWYGVLSDRGLFVHVMQSSWDDQRITDIIKSRYQHQYRASGNMKSYNQLNSADVTFQSFHFKSGFSSKPDTYKLYPLYRMIDTRTNDTLDITCEPFTLSGIAQNEIQTMLDKVDMEDPAKAQEQNSSILKRLLRALQEEHEDGRDTTQNGDDIDTSEAQIIQSTSDASTTAQILQSTPLPTGDQSGNEEEYKSNSTRKDDTDDINGVDTTEEQMPTHQQRQPLNSHADGTGWNQPKPTETQGDSKTNSQNLNNSLSRMSSDGLVMMTIAGNLIFPALCSTGLVAIKKYQKQRC